MSLPRRPARIHDHHACRFSLGNRHISIADTPKERSRLLLKAILVSTVPRPMTGHALIASPRSTQTDVPPEPLVVTADDFGLAPEVNEAVELGHRQGILSAASLMVAGAAAASGGAFSRMMPIASPAWSKRLGYKRWLRIHQLVYIVVALVSVHFIWRVKADISQPLTYAIILGSLLGVRVLFWLGKRRSAAISGAVSGPNPGK